MLTLARSNIVEIEKIQFVREYIQNSIPLDVLYRDPESNSAVGVAASRREDRLAEVFGETLKHIETQIIEETKIKKIQKELKVIKHKNHRKIFQASLLSRNLLIA